MNLCLKCIRNLKIVLNRCYDFRTLDPMYILTHPKVAKLILYIFEFHIWFLLNFILFKNNFCMILVWCISTIILIAVNVFDLCMKLNSMWKFWFEKKRNTTEIMEFHWKKLETYQISAMQKTSNCGRPSNTFSWNSRKHMAEASYCW